MRTLRVDQIRDYNTVDIHCPWYDGRPLASLGSMVVPTAGSVVVFDFSIECDSNPHYHIKLRAARLEETPKGRNLGSVLGDEYKKFLWLGSISA